MNLKDLDDAQYGLLFDVRRSVRYHDRRRGFFDRLHRLTNLLTILMAGSVLYDLGKTGETAGWLVVLSAAAALLAALDMVVGYSAWARRHHDLKTRFCALEIDMLSGGLAPATWQAYAVRRLQIERDEPPVFRALDLLCRDELLIAEGITHERAPGEFSGLGWWPRWTSQVWHWSDVAAQK